MFETVKRFMILMSRDQHNGIEIIIFIHVNQKNKIYFVEILKFQFVQIKVMKRLITGQK